MKLSLALPPFSCPENIRGHLIKVFEGEYEVPLFRYAPVILDLGANCGAFSVWASHRWPGSFIHAYEPHPDNFMFLRENLAAYPSVTLHNYAVGEPGFRALSNGRHNDGEASLFEVANNPYPTGRHVEVRSPLELPEADIIKLDVEGAEVEILRPLIEAGRRPSAILIEWHNDSLRREIDSLLGDYRITGAEVHSSGERGTFNFLRKDLT